MLVYKAALNSPMLQPHVNANIKEQLKHRQTTQKNYYDKTTKNLPILKPNDTVWYQSKQSWEPAVVLNHHPVPRSYNIRTAEGTTLRRNRRHLKKNNEDPPDVTTTIENSFTTDDSASAVNNQVPHVVNVEPPHARAVPLNEKRTRSGRVVRPPVRYSNN